MTTMINSIGEICRDRQPGLAYTQVNKYGSFSGERFRCSLSCSEVSHKILFIDSIY